MKDLIIPWDSDRDMGTPAREGAPRPLYHRWPPSIAPRARGAPGHPDHRRH